ncbi:MAG: hypothetical protein KF729_07695 [Sandaracinaceae bacterium]|nr:hypothetical protein [Sandaracinaceae bacterium]
MRPVLSSRWSAALAFGLCLGCSALVNPDVDRLGGDPGADSGVTLMDGATPRPDAGPPRDGGGAACVEGTRTCAGDVLVVCAGGAERREDCAATGGICREGGCRPRACTPGTRTCADDGGSVLACSADGGELSVIDCGDGRCDPSTLACVEGACRGLDEIRVGSTETLDLCDESDDDTYERDSAQCRATTRASVGDRVFVLRLAMDTRVVIELTDVDEDAAIDTIVYLRTVCDDPTTQIGCADDVPCMASTAQPPYCVDGVDVRQSRLVATLRAGTYYVVVDGFRYSRSGVSFGCGEVRLAVRAAPGSTPGG